MEHAEYIENVMDTDRYEILETIAVGEFATVYRARDRDLGREVAVKQIHGQYLGDPRQLAKYWQEAQLLASLQHPNILTIYDVVRPRGWLILELMRSSLKPAAEGDPMDLEQLRAVLINCLSGLAFLHSNKVIHGDVKPSNILVSPQNRVKLGDFGLARRASNEEGSLLKGTTKYMAPELLSVQFGRVGRASDLYSLGITAYELMVGRHFESLLPTLSTFGRDKQLAWMMWHSTADVKLPDVHRVLEGVPDDLAHVIQRLIAKDPSQRYATAPEALQDLHTGHTMGDGLIDAAVAEAEAAAAQIAKRKKRIRHLTFLCGAAVIALSAWIVFLLFASPPKTKAQPLPESIHGTISDVYPVSHELGVSPANGGAVQRIVVKDQDIIYVNGQKHLLEELESGDVVDITKTIDKNSLRDVREIHAKRPGRFATGLLITKNEKLRTIDMASGQASHQTELLTIFVPADLPISLNGATTFHDQPVTISSLVAGDRLKATYDYREASGNRATKLEVLRPVELKGVLAADFDARTHLLSVLDDRQRIVKLPFASDYRIFVNQQPMAEPSALKRGDHVSLRHDSFITEVVAQRTAGAEGVVEQVRFDPPQSLAVTDVSGQKAVYSVGPDCSITLGGETVPFDVLRAGDRVAVEHGAIDPKSRKFTAATSIAVERPTDPSRWALLIAVQNYDDTLLGKLDTSLADAAALAETMTKRYRVPAEQLRAFADPSAATLEREVPDFIKRLPADARLMVYFIGHACRGANGQVYLAPKDFRSDKPEINGRALQWLVDVMEECPAKEKLLLLDASHAGAGVQQASEPSTAEMIGSLKLQPNRALLRTVTAVASCQAGQRGLDLPDKQHGLFAVCLAEGYGGAADVSHNTRVEPTQLFAFLQEAMLRAGQGKQSPQLFLPDDRPPRLTDRAKAILRRLADRAAQAEINPDELDLEYQEALRASGSEPEPKLIYGLLLLKRIDGKGRERAIEHFQAVKSEMPNRLLAYAALAWLRLRADRHLFSPAVDELIAMVGKIAEPAGPDSPYSTAEARFLFQWAGQLREYAAGVGEPSRQLSESLAALDAAVARHGRQAVDLYGKGRQDSAAVLADFDARIAESKDEVEISRIKVDRRQLSKYADFPLDKYLKQVRIQLEQ